MTLLVLLVEMIIPYLINFSDTRPSSQWGNEIMKVIYEIVPTWPLAVMIIPSSGGNGFGSTVAMRSLSPKKGCLSPSKQSATTPECYDTRVPPVHQSGATSMTLFWWHTEAWVAVGGTQKVFEKKWKWWFWRNTNGDSGEIQTPEARGIRVRLGGNGGRRKIEYYWVGNLFGNWGGGKKSPIIISSLSAALFFPRRGKMRRSQLNGLIRESEASLSSKRHKT